MTKRVYATFATNDFSDLGGGIIKGPICKKIVNKTPHCIKTSEANRSLKRKEESLKKYFYGVCRRLKNGEGWLVIWVNAVDSQPTSNYLVACIVDRTNAVWNHDKILSLKHERQNQHPHRSSKGKITHWSRIWGHPSQAY